MNKIRRTSFEKNFKSGTNEAPEGRCDLNFLCSRLPISMKLFDLWNILLIIQSLFTACFFFVECEEKCSEPCLSPMTARVWRTCHQSRVILKRFGPTTIMILLALLQTKSAHEFVLNPHSSVWLNKFISVEKCFFCSLTLNRIIHGEWRGRWRLPANNKKVEKLSRLFCRRAGGAWKQTGYRNRQKSKQTNKEKRDPIDRKLTQNSEAGWHVWIPDEFMVFVEAPVVKYRCDKVHWRMSKV